MMGDESHDSVAPDAGSVEGWVTFRQAIEYERTRRQIGPAFEPKKLRIYIAGPCTGIPNENRPAFLAGELQLRGLGFDVVNPTTLAGHGAHDQSWASFMKVDLPALCTCEAVALLPGWEASKGANLERHNALTLGMDVRLLADWLAPAEQCCCVGDVCRGGDVVGGKLANGWRCKAAMAGTHRPAPSSDPQAGLVGSVAHSVRCHTSDSEGGDHD